MTPTYSSASSQVTLGPLLQLVPLEDNESSCFEWYLRRSAKKLPGAFNSRCWNDLLVQASTTEPAVRHAVLALSSTHRQEVSGPGSQASETNDGHALFTTRQYSKAIAHLQPCFSDSRRTSVRITLITCALFIYMEFLRGHYTRGLLHLEHGIRLLQGVGTYPSDQDPSSTYVDGWLLTVFTRLLVQAKQLGQLPDLRLTSLNLLGSREPEVDTFRSCHHARRSLEHIMLRIFSLQEHSHQQSPAVQNELQKHQATIQSDLKTWTKTHASTLQTLPPTHDPLEVFAYHLLPVYHLTATIQAGTCLTLSNTMLFDHYTSTFSSIVTHNISLYKARHPPHPHNVPSKAHHDPEPTSPNSISDIGWIAPLFFTAVNCRNHRLRHQAVRLLQCTSHKEGIWDARLSVIVARKVIEIEEGDVYNGEDGEFDMFETPMGKDLTGGVLPEDRRLREVKIGLPDDRVGKVLLRCWRRGGDGGVEWIGTEYDLSCGRWRYSI